MDETKLDSASRQQLRIIAIETSIEDVKKAFFERLVKIENAISELEIGLRNHSNVSFSLSGLLLENKLFETRIKVLEDARQRQIYLNKEFEEEYIKLKTFRELN